MKVFADQYDKFYIPTNHMSVEIEELCMQTTIRCIQVSASRYMAVISCLYALHGDMWTGVLWIEVCEYSATRNCVPLASIWVLARALLFIVLFFSVVLWFCLCLSSFSVMCTQYFQCIWTVHSRLPLRYSLTLIYYKHCLWNTRSQ